jgi:hypothetical protein
LVQYPHDLYSKVLRLSSRGDHALAARVLTVGDPVLWGGAIPPQPANMSMYFSDIDAIGAELIETLKPDFVLSPLLSRKFDCIDLAMILVAAGFRGRYRAVTDDLPRPEVIRYEVRDLCPTLDFDIILVDAKVIRLS